jgi:hypothetical protein
VNDILGRYTSFLLTGFTLQLKLKNTVEDSKVLVGTIKGYLRVVNQHYLDNQCRVPWDPKDDSKASILLREQSKFESEPAKRSALHPHVLQKMCDLAKISDPLSFRACCWDFTGLGTCGGFRKQEFAMDSKTVVKVYVLPDGTHVVRAFTNSNFIKALGTRFALQKNRMNGQTIKHDRLPDKFEDYCPVRIGHNVILRAQLLGRTADDDALCVYKDDDGSVVYLTGDAITDYYRFITKLVMPNISDAELSLISTHSLRVTACVLLHEAGKDGSYIKLRLRWLSNCFEIYLRNTKKITEQHASALEEVHSQMVAVAAAVTGHNDIDNAIHVAGNVNMIMDELEDED